MESIKSVQIRNLRGIVDLCINLDGKSLIIQAENGMGKSSIVDAIEFFFKGKISHLEQANTISTLKHGPHINSNKEDMKVEIIFNPCNVALARTINSAYQIPSYLSNYFDITTEGTFILRRAQILEFIISQPAERFRSIGNILGINILDNIELNIMHLKEEFKGELDVIVYKVNLFKKGLPCQGDNLKLINYVNDILKKHSLSYISSLEELPIKLESMHKQIKQDMITGEFKDIIEALSNLSDIYNQFNEINSRINEYCTKINELIKEEFNKRFILYDQLFRTAKEILSLEKKQICPLCEQNINFDSTFQKVSDRISMLAKLSEKASNTREIGVILKNVIKNIISKIKSVCNKAKTSTGKESEMEVFSNTIINLNLIIANISELEEIKTPINTDSLISIFNKSKSAIKDIIDKLTQKLEEIDITEQDKILLEDITSFKDIKKNLDEIKRLELEINTQNKIYNLSEKLFRYFSQCKKEEVQNIFNAIEKDICIFYSKIHETDLYSNIKLTINSGKRASAEIKADIFNRQNEDPRGLFSEGHLDTLGLCIFLAFVKNFNQNCSLIILDDVVSTVDSQHREKIANLLINEFDKKQLIITTHDNIWNEQLQSVERAYKKEGNFCNCKITNWTLNTGPYLTPYKPRIERIRQKIEEGDNQAGNECRIYLEWLLEQIAINIETAIIIKRSQRYELNELLPPVRNRILELIEDDTLKKEFDAIFKKIEANRFIANITSHHNESALNLSKSELDNLLKNICELHGMVSCKQCNNFLKYYRELKKIRCSHSCEEPTEIKTK